MRGMFKWGVSIQLIPANAPIALQTDPGLCRGRTTAPNRKKVRPIPQLQVEACLLLVSPQDCGDDQSTKS